MQIARKIAEMVRSHLPPANAIAGLENDFETLQECPEMVSFISIARLDGLVENSWTVADVGLLQENIMADIQERLAEKQLKLKKYKSHCQVNHLLIVASGRAPSSFFDPDNATLSTEYESGLIQCIC